MITNRFILFAALLGAVCSTARGQDTTDSQDVLVFKKADGGYATVTSSKTSFEGEITIPASVVIDGETLAVKQIAAWAFNGAAVNPTKVTIQGKDVEIANYAFLRCTELKAVEVTGSIKSIGYAAFEDCESLESIDLNEGLETIDERGFAGCTLLKQVAIPKSVTSLGNDCFSSCSALEKVYFEGGGLRTSQITHSMDATSRN